MIDLNEQLRAAFEAIAPKFGIDTTVPPAGFRKSAAEPFKYVHSNHLFAIFCEGAARALPAPQAAPSDLHAAIMNIPCKVDWNLLLPEERAYRRGHRDARHAAAELVAAAPAVAITQAATSGKVLMPMKLTPAMQRVLDEEGWQWEDLLAAAEAITDEQYDELSHSEQAATSEPVAAAGNVETDMARRLRAIVAEQPTDRLMSIHVTVARTVLATAADECDRFYNGMMAWKRTAQAKDAAHLAGTTPNTEAPSDERAAFEQHALDTGWTQAAINDRSGDDYSEPFLADAWFHYRAALSAQQAGVQEAPSEDAKDAARYRLIRDAKPNSLTIERNGDHSCNYVTAAEWIENYCPGDFAECDAQEIQRMKDTDTIWKIQIYPNTPIGFNWWFGATLDSVVDAALAAATQTEKP